MHCSAGDTFINNQRSANEPLTHLWFILTDPIDYPSEIVIVNLTTWREDKDYQDGTCTLEPGDHPFIQHTSWIKYDQAKVVDLKTLVLLYKRDLICLNDPATPELLERLREGAALSPHTPGKVINVLEKHRLID